MSKQTINIGASPNDGTGTPLRTSFDYTNQNFTELYTAVGPSGNNIVVPGNATITGDLTVDTSTLKVDSTNNRVGIGTASPGAALEVSGSATNIFIRSTDTNDSALRYYVNGTEVAVCRGKNGGSYAIETAGTERLRIDTSGNVGIGVTPSAWLSSLSALQVKGVNGLYGAGSSEFGSVQNCFYNASSQWIYGTTAAAGKYAISSGVHQWYNAPSGTAGNAITFTQAMTLDASGNLLVGTPSSLPSFNNGRIEVLAVASSYCIVADATATSAAAIGIRGNDSTVAASFYNASTGGTVGSIVINSGGVSYNTTSDYRLKESVKPISGGLARVNALKPSIYNWKSNGSTGEGFIAHELAEVVPFAVSGEKDAMNADGTIKSQGIDMSRIVPILVAAIQELTARVQTLEAR